ncbi:MAG: hypothetical protein IT389_09205 [Nitrospira sp.]|nr:hypothetical protein [Nitrospira sp.]
MSCSMCDPSGGRNPSGKAQPHSRCALLLVAILFVSIRFPGPVEAEWSALAESKVLYTDNVFEFSSSRRLALAEDPSQPAIVPVDKASDVVWESSVDLRHRSRPTSLGETEVSVKAAGFVFTDNPIFNHGNYRIQVKQALDADTSILIRYRFVPNLFLGPNVERRTGLRFQAEERVTSHVWRLQLERRLSDTVTGTLVSRYGVRQFNEAFAERDTAFWSAGPQVDWRIVPRVMLSLAYLFEQGLADGREQTQFRDDVSYRQHITSIGATVQITDPLALTVGYVYRRKEFISEIVGDSNRGVVDATHQGTAEFSYRLSAAAIMTLGVQRSQRQSNVSAREFFNTNASIGIQYRF